MAPTTFEKDENYSITLQTQRYFVDGPPIIQVTQTGTLAVVFLVDIARVTAGFRPQKALIPVCL